MSFWVTAIKILGYVWLCFAALLIFAGFVGIWIKEGFLGVQGLLSPFNLVNWIVPIITLAPGIGLLMISEKLQSKVHVSH